MKFTRVFITALSSVATFYFVGLLPIAIIPALESMPVVATLISAAAAVLVGRFVWRQFDSASPGLLSYALTGAVIVGAIGFVAGFIGPMVFAPGANQGPLLGIFITGPLGFVVGGIGGAIYWGLRGKREETVA